MILEKKFWVPLALAYATDSKGGIVEFLLGLLLITEFGGFAIRVSEETI